MAKTFKSPVVAGAEEPYSMGPLSDLMAVRLGHLQHLFVRSFTATTKQRDLRSGMLSTLALIVGNPGISQNEIAQATGIDKSAIVAIINRFEELGWAVRKRSERDKRVQRLHATEAGEAELTQLAAEMRKIEDELLEEVSPDDLAQFEILLRRMQYACRMTLKPR